MKKILIFIAVLFCIMSCKTTKMTLLQSTLDSTYIKTDSVDIEKTYVEKPVEVETTKEEYTNKEYRDSVYIHDSIYVREKNDTVYIYKEKYNYKYLIKSDTLLRIDTIPKIIYMHDSVYKYINALNDSIKILTDKQVITNTVEVNKLKWWLKLLIWIGAIASICGLVYGGFKLGKLYIKK